MPRAKIIFPYLAEAIVQPTDDRVGYRKGDHGIEIDEACIVAAQDLRVDHNLFYPRRLQLQESRIWAHVFCVFAIEPYTA